MAWVMPAITGVWAVMEVVAFIQFIEEEAIQSAALGAFLAIRQRNTKAAWKAIILLETEIIPHLDRINREIGWASPYSWGCFHDFVVASQLNVEIYKELCFAMPK
ncbi:unnamed protein product [marine sediment metagenome]|uniref:Uncharacterized protein n=1 Tax=marine sediment metagenome TaxID=412755 RepID=X1IZB3_9ZZZZ